MKAIKNIFYLDYEKMYSLSSQLFQGLTLESVVAEARQLSDAEKKKSTLLDAKELENILTDNFSLSKTVNLHDYNYSKFEDELEAQGKVLNIDEKFDLSKIPDNLNKFVKSKGRILIIDPVSMCNLLERFKEESIRLQYISTHEDILEIDSQLVMLSYENQSSAIKSEVAQLKSAKKKITDELELFGKKIDQKFYNELSKMVSFAAGNDIQIHQVISPLNSISTFLTREFMKTNMESFVKRYSRKTVIDFTLFGMISQYNTQPMQIQQNENEKFKYAIRNVTDATYDLEATFSGPDEHEIIIDPIALYMEI